MKPDLHSESSNTEGMGLKTLETRQTAREDESPKRGGSQGTGKAPGLPTSAGETIALLQA